MSERLANMHSLGASKEGRRHVGSGEIQENG